MFSDPASDLQHDLEVVKEVNEKLRSKDVQEILKAAAESEKKDPTGLQPRRGKRSEKSKSHDAPSPESPMAFPSFQPPSSQLLPSADLISAPLKLEGLADFIRDYNKSHNNRLHIWTSTSRQQATALHNFPVTVRFTIPDVVAVYLTLGCNPTDETIIVESATAFGPAERKPPHSQSDYAVYQKLSQQLAKCLPTRSFRGGPYTSCWKDMDSQAFRL
ncbi:unnamed protein product [Somion occarium]|uniref:Uncharacterized protein n=1 Tax=Somion occarium TaxID=3059160 RepID=A0ABP1DLS9_9APHY